MADQPQTDVSRRRRIAGWVGSARGAWIARGRGFMVVTALAGVLLAGLAVSASAKLLASSLAARDPGARLGGDTIVATGKGGRVVGARNRSNFIVALGSGQTIVGGARHDELGALGADTTIIGGGGKDLIHAGRGVTLVKDSGRALIIERKNDATVRVSGPRDELVVTGRHDRVLCAKGSRNDLIYVRAGDFISPACRADGARVLPASRFRSTPAEPPRVGDPPTPITGDGSNGNPFTTSCQGDYFTPDYPDVCIIGFDSVVFQHGLWDNGYVPAYKCPADHPYLFNMNVGPQGSTLPNGVAYSTDGDVGVFISLISTTRVPPVGGDDYRTGTQTGFGTSATNWDGPGSSYTISLWCTNVLSHGYHQPG